MEYRVIGARDEAAALELWYPVFEPPAGFFERYFTADPWYREGDCLGAFEGDRLVSAAHFCRRPLKWDGETVWCAAVANVATLPEYRRQGLSRDLLRMAIERMEREGLDFSMLFTRAYGHYGALGWEMVPTPMPILHLRREDDHSVISTDIQEMVRKDWEALTALWLKSARPLHLQRTPQYTAGWSGWEWRRRGGRVFVLPDRGYLVLSEARNDGDAVVVEEWASDTAESEMRLLRHAAGLARAVGRSKVRLNKLPISSPEALAQIGVNQIDRSDYMMLRNVGMAPERYQALIQAYASGAAVWWPADDF